MSLRRRIAANILSQYGMRALTLVIGFALIPFLTRKLGVEAFGVIVLFESLVQLSEAALTGLRAALSRHAAVAWAQGRTEDFERYLAAGRTILVGIAAVFLALGVWFAFSLPGWLRIPDPLREPARALFALFSVSFAVSVPNAAYRAGLYAKERFDRLNLALSSAFIFRAAAIWALFSWAPAGWPMLPLYGVAHLGTSLVRAFAIRIEFDRLFPHSRRRMRGFDAAKMREIFSFGSYSFLVHAAVAIHGSLVVFLVNALWGPASGALYGVGTKIPGALHLGFKEPAWALAPTVTALAARNERSTLHELIFFYTKASALLVAPLCLAIGYYASDLLRAWTGEHFVHASGVLVWAVSGLFFSLPFAVCDSLPAAYGYIRKPALVGVALCAASVGLAYGLGAWAGWGLPGFAAGVSIISVVYAIGYAAPLACRLSGFSLRSYYLAGFFKPASSAVVFAGLFFAGLRLAGLEPVSIKALLLALPFAAGYAVCAWRGVLNARERQIVLRFFKKTRAETASEV